MGSDVVAVNFESALERDFGRGQVITFEGRHAFGHERGCPFLCGLKVWLTFGGVRRKGRRGRSTEHQADESLSEAASEEL
jgi:hypothetical protein